MLVITNDKLAHNTGMWFNGSLTVHTSYKNLVLESFVPSVNGYRFKQHPTRRNIQLNSRHSTCLLK